MVVQVVEIMGGDAVEGLAYPPVAAVIAIGGHGSPCFFNPDQTIESIPGVGQGAVGDDVAVGIIAVALGGSTSQAGDLVVAAVDGGGLGHAGGGWAR